MAEMGLEQLQNAQIEVKVRGKTFKMRRITVDDMAAIKQGLKDAMRESILSRRPALQPSSMFAQIYAEAERYRPSDAEMWAEINSIDGQTNLLAKCMGLTRAQLLALAAENGGIPWLADAGEALLIESGLWVDMSKEATADRPTSPPSSGNPMPPTFSAPSQDTRSLP